MEGCGLKFCGWAFIKEGYVWVGERLIDTSSSLLASASRKKLGESGEPLRVLLL